MRVNYRSAFISSLLLLSLLGPMKTGAAQAPAIDLALARGHFQEAQTVCARDAGRLWGLSLCGPMLFIEPESIIPCMGIMPPRLTSVRIVQPTARELRIQSVVRRPFDMFYPLELPYSRKFDSRAERLVLTVT